MSDLGQWRYLFPDSYVLFAGGFREEHIVARAVRDLDGRWLYSTVSANSLVGGFADAEAAKAAAESELIAAMTPGTRKIIPFPFERAGWAREGRA